MPCYDGYPPSTRDRDQSADYYRDFEHNSPLAEAMCSVLRQLHADPLTPESLGVELSSYLKAWWDTHKTRDAQRIAAETAALEKKRVANEALKKLTPEERKLLGLPRKV